MDNDRFLYGKADIQGITSIDDVSDWWILYPYKKHPSSIRLAGDLHYKWATVFDTREDWIQAKRDYCDKFVVYDEVEAHMIRHGQSYYLGMKPEDVSVLSFDIETTTLDPKHPAAKVLLISNTLRKGGGVLKKLFDFRDYRNQKEMINAWCKFLCDMDPSILVGHNIFGFDIPYLRSCNGGSLPIGRGGVEANVPSRSSRFRKDGSQSYDYLNTKVRGRELVDTFFLSIKYDIARNYPSYGLKQIIEHEGLERPGRQHYDASLIHKNYHDPVEWKKIKEYCKDDADDSLALFDLMIPSYFYYAQSIPMPFQAIINRASGSQVNAFMVRSYLQEGHSIPKANDVERFEGGISFGQPGIYKNVGKVDVASLYPSIIRQYKIYNAGKDPKKNFLRMVELFTDERLSNKRLANETGDRQYRDLEQAQKIIINSAYGFLGAPGLNFNSPRDAAAVTRYGRKVLKEGLDWAETKGMTIVNADTDSFAFTIGRPFDEIEFDMMIGELNRIFPKGIIWEDDGIYEKFVVVKAKNYILQQDGKVKIKGSGLKASMKEPALKLFIKDVINCILEDNVDGICALYDRAVRDINSITDDTISLWSSKKTITKAVLNPERTTEQRILDAVNNSDRLVQEGDKIHVFFKSDTEVCLVEGFTGEYSKPRLLEKLFKTIKVFETILSMDRYPNYKLKRNLEFLESLLKEAV